MEKFKSIMAEVLEVDSIEMTDELTAFDSWDSLTILSIIAVVSDEYHVEFTREEIENSLTISGLKKLIENICIYKYINIPLLIHTLIQKHQHKTQRFLSHHLTLQQVQVNNLELPISGFPQAVNRY